MFHLFNMWPFACCILVSLACWENVLLIPGKDSYICPFCDSTNYIFDHAEYAKC